MKPMTMKYLNLFFSPILINQLDLNIDSLIEFCYEMKRKDEKGVEITNVGGWQSDNVVHETHEEFTKLVTEVKKNANQYHSDVDFKKEYEQKIGNIWININGKGHSNKDHVHQFSVLSGCFYLTDSKFPIIFNHPYADITNYYWGEEVIENWNAINSGTWKVSSDRNTLLIFPSWLKHSVAMNKEDSDRISMSFNTQFDLQ